MVHLVRPVFANLMPQPNELPPKACFKRWQPAVQDRGKSTTSLACHATLPNTEMHEVLIDGRVAHVFE